MDGRNWGGGGGGEEMDGSGGWGGILKVQIDE